jgi:hypothetical protein
MCGRSFRTFRCFQLKGTKFCSRECRVAAQRAFTQALADGRLNDLLAEERAKAKALAAPKSRRYKNDYWPEWLEEKTT